MVDKKLYTVAEVLEIIPISRSGLYSALKREEIKSICIGRRVLIPGWAISNLIDMPKVSNN